MNETRWRGTVPAYVLAFGIFLVDQLTKTLIEWGLNTPGKSIPIVETVDFFRLTYVLNSGAAWGILQGFQPLFVLVAVIVSGICIWAIEAAPMDYTRYGWACVLGGGVGNMVDRIFTNAGVVDFLDVGIYGYRWPTFNVADAALTIGMLWLAYHVLLGDLLERNHDGEDGGGDE